MKPRRFQCFQSATLSQRLKIPTGSVCRGETTKQSIKAQALCASKGRLLSVLFNMLLCTLGSKSSPCLFKGPPLKTRSENNIKLYTYTKDLEKPKLNSQKWQIFEINSHFKIPCESKTNQSFTKKKKKNQIILDPGLRIPVLPSLPPRCWLSLYNPINSMFQCKVSTKTLSLV